MHGKPFPTKSQLQVQSRFEEWAGGDTQSLVWYAWKIENVDNSTILLSCLNMSCSVLILILKWNISRWEWNDEAWEEEINQRERERVKTSTLSNQFFPCNKYFLQSFGGSFYATSVHFDILLKTLFHKPQVNFPPNYPLPCNKYTFPLILASFSKPTSMIISQNPPKN